jgi:formylglycine-generating enzyme required for sulfatase activity
MMNNPETEHKAWQPGNMQVDAMEAAEGRIPDLFITVPETTLPCGTVVPSFMVGQYAASKYEDGKLGIVPHLKPWVNINYHKAKQVCADAGYSMITELQWLAIAHDVANVDANWTKGKVGEGKLFRGIRKGIVSEVQAGDVVPADVKERRWLMLSNGQQICDINGNLYQWVFDDVQGDENGIVAKPFSKESPTISTPPYPSMKKGMGWQPGHDSDWSGDALIRGGFWVSGDGAGVFNVNCGWPGDVIGSVGFRCTKSL